jgi:hypothetical protein
MAHVQHVPGQRAASSSDLARFLLIIGAAVALMLIANAVFGLAGPGPSLDFAPDPAGLALPF